MRPGPSDTGTGPRGKVMRRAGRKRGEFEGGSRSGPISHRPSRRECAARPIRSDCAPSGIRTAQRSIHEPARERAKAPEGTDGFVASTKLRRWVERVFACIKRHDDLRRVRLRGSGERFLLATTARNLKRMVRLLAPTSGPLAVAMA